MKAHSTFGEKLGEALHSMNEAIAERDRLRALNAELLRAVKLLVSDLDRSKLAQSWVTMGMARAAIAKAEQVR